MSDWQTRFAYLLDDLDPEGRRRVAASIQNGVLSGYEPTEADVRVMVCLELGEITSLQAMADIASRHGPRARQPAVDGRVARLPMDQVAELEAMRDLPETPRNP